LFTKANAIFKILTLRKKVRADLKKYERIRKTASGPGYRLFHNQVVAGVQTRPQETLILRRRKIDGGEHPIVHMKGKIKANFLDLVVSLSHQKNNDDNQQDQSRRAATHPNEAAQHGRK
jgi:hypothetical protein